MKQIIPTRVAEIVYALVMIVFAVFHFKYGLPKLPEFIPGPSSMWAIIVATGFLAAGIAIIINKYKRLACYLLALMFFIFILAIHLLPAIYEHSYHQPLKDTCLAMAAIIIGNNASSK